MPIEAREPRGESRNSQSSDFIRVEQRSPSKEKLEKVVETLPPSSPPQSVKSHTTQVSCSDRRSFARKLSIEDNDGTFDVGARPKTVNLIESLYGTAMAEIVHYTSGSRTGLAGITVVYLIVNIVFQGYLLYAMKVYICAPVIAEIRHVYSDFRDETHVDGVLSVAEWHAWDSHEKAKLCQIPLSQPVLFALLLGVWTSYVLIDLRETIVYAWAWSTLPHPSKFTPDTREGVKVSRRDDMVIAEAASYKVKVIVLVFVLIPKFVIAVVLWYLGTLWLTATPSFENLVLNAAALVFITNIDEVLYTAWASNDMKMETTRMQIRLPGTSDSYRKSHGFWEMIFWTILNVVAPLVYLFHAQLVIPDYHWDLSSLCRSRIEELNSAAELRGMIG